MWAWPTPRGHRVHETGWIILTAVAVGPILLGLLLHRLGFSRAVSLGLGLVIVGSALLLAWEPPIDSHDEAERLVLHPSPGNAGADRDEITALREAHGVAKAEIEDLRRQLHAAGAKPSAMEKLQALEVARKQLSDALQTANSERDAARIEADDARRRLVIAEATIARLEAAARTAPPNVGPPLIPFTPTPFSTAPREDTVEPKREAAPATEIATGATEAAEASVPAAPRPLGAALAEAAQSRQFELEAISDTELVVGRPGSYYRIRCPDGRGGKRLNFASGAYTFDGGNKALKTCFEAVQRLLLDAFPPTTTARLYVQGFASRSGFIKPRRIPPHDQRLKSVTFLPRNDDRERFVAHGERQTVADEYGNAELPILRAAFVADWIATSTNGAIRPEILEGALKPTSDPASLSFDLVLHAAW